MKTIIVYSSQTGFTEKYAKWISEALECDLMPLKKAKKIDLLAYDSVIYGGWFCAGSVNNLKWFLDKIPTLVKNNKKIVIYAVGGSPIENPELSVTLNNIAKSIDEKLPENTLNKSVYKLVYCPGGFNYDKMNFASKLMMKMFLSMLKANKEKTSKDMEMINMISSNYDISHKKYIEPILNFLK
ncbi:MAG: flavodoxin [Spirochaetaceae bacterium]|nr:flavodoxin [Spirochaetaceae bacterium]